MWVDGNGYTLLSLRDLEGFPKATLLLGDGPFVAANRLFKAHPGYTTCRAFDDRAHVVNRRMMVFLQCCPRGYPSGDLKCKTDETQRVRKWWSFQPTYIGS